MHRKGSISDVGKACTKYIFISSNNRFETVLFALEILQTAFLDKLKETSHIN